MKERSSANRGHKEMLSPAFASVSHHGDRSNHPHPIQPPLRPDDPQNHHHHPSPAANRNTHPQHDHRFNRKPLGGDVEEAWESLSLKNAVDVNLLATSLTTRLRKSSHRLRATTTSSSSPRTTTIVSSASSSEGGEGGWGYKSAPPTGPDAARKISKSDSTVTKDVTFQQPQSILKRNLSNEIVEQQYRYLLEYRSGSGQGSKDDFNLPDVFLTQQRRLSSSRHLEDSDFNSQLLDRPSPNVAVRRGGGERGGAGVGGVGAGEGGGSSTPSSNGHITWVKRAGIFQPADKYAPGRQTLHGEDQPFALSQPIDYETITLASRSASRADSDTDSDSGWPSCKSMKRKGLKVSWKQPRVSEDEQEGDHSRTNASTSRAVGRQKSAGILQNELGEGGGVAFSFVKPRFNTGKSCVPVVGVKWKVPTPSVGRSPQGERGSALGEGANSSSLEELSRCCSSTSTSSIPMAPMAHPSKPTSRNWQHPWRSLQLRHDVHPVTTAMDREGTSVSRTKWQVPSLRPVPAYTFLEDYFENSGHLLHWNPSVSQGRVATRATLDSQSMQNRAKEDIGGESGKDTIANASVSTLGSTNTDNHPPACSRS